MTQPTTLRVRAIAPATNDTDEDEDLTFEMSYVLYETHNWTVRRIRQEVRKRLGDGPIRIVGVWKIAPLPSMDGLMFP